MAHTMQIPTPTAKATVGSEVKLCHVSAITYLKTSQRAPTVKLTLTDIDAIGCLPFTQKVGGSTPIGGTSERFIRSNRPGVL